MLSWRQVFAAVGELSQNRYLARAAVAELAVVVNVNTASAGITASFFPVKAAAPVPAAPPARVPIAAPFPPPAIAPITAPAAAPPPILVALLFVWLSPCLLMLAVRTVFPA